MTLWIAVPDEQRRQATQTLIDTGIPVQGTWTGPTPGTPRRHDLGVLFFLTATGLPLIGLSVWGFSQGGWWAALGALGALAGIICLSVALSRPTTD